MKRMAVELKSCRFEVLTDGKRLAGLGKIWIGRTLVRSGRLPISVYTQTFGGLETSHLELVDIQRTKQEIRLRARMFFRPMNVKIMRDHSYDPIHDLGDWDTDAVAGVGELDIVLRPASDTFNGVAFEGFRYHYEYRTQDTPIYYLHDRASWELGGDILGVTAISQSSYSPPVVTFAKETAWSTEAIMDFLRTPDNSQNAVMTHNLPRWASHGAFDYQYKGDDTLIGLFERVELIRSVQCRDAGKPELKTFDKHIFDQATEFATSPKKILLNRAPRSRTQQHNLWGWVFEETDARARDEYGIREEPFIPHLFQNFWVDFTVDSYYKDLLPAAVAIGAKRLFTDNLKKSVMTARMTCPNLTLDGASMCSGHEYEIAPELGGVKRVKAFVAEAHKHDVHPMCWTNNDQAHTSPINTPENQARGWFVRMEDARSKWGGAYSASMCILDFSNPEVRDYFVKTHVAIKKQTGIDTYFFDSFYNLGFMPVSYINCKPRTMWKGMLEVWRRLQQAGLALEMESFGPWGQVQHGHSSEYNIENIFACYKVGVGNDYTTVPSGHPLKNVSNEDAAGVYYTLAHMAGCHMPLHFPDGRRIDEVWGAEHRRALADYHAAVSSMNRRYLQEDGQAVIWHDYAGTRATVFNFVKRNVSLPGKVKDISTGKPLPAAASYELEANHTYVITGAELPREF